MKEANLQCAKRVHKSGCYLYIIFHFEASLVISDSRDQLRAEWYLICLIHAWSKWNSIWAFQCLLKKENISNEDLLLEVDKILIRNISSPSKRCMIYYLLFPCYYVPRKSDYILYKVINETSTINLSSVLCIPSSLN